MKTHLPLRVSKFSWIKFGGKKLPEYYHSLYKRNGHCHQFKWGPNKILSCQAAIGMDDSGPSCWHRLVKKKGDIFVFFALIHVAMMPSLLDGFPLESTLFMANQTFSIGLQSNVSPGWALRTLMPLFWHQSFQYKCRKK